MTLDIQVLNLFTPVVNLTLACSTDGLAGSSAIHERARSARREKSACSHTIVYALPSPWNDWHERMRENKAIQITNLQMYTWRKTVNRREHLNLAKFKSCCARTNKGGKNLNIELRRRKARTNSGWKKQLWRHRTDLLDYSSLWRRRTKLNMIRGEKPYSLTVLI